MYLNGEFEERESVIQALRDLKDNGLAPEDLDVFSDVPLEIPRTALDRPSHMSLAVVTGAVAFCLLIVGFVYFAQHNYPIITGGMPIFSFWATGVVFYELTMFGAVLTSLFWFLRESGLLSRKRRLPAPSFQPGLICLRVRCAADQEHSVHQLLEKAGASNLSTEGDA